MEYLVGQSRDVCAEPSSIGLVDWNNWSAMDQAARMAWNEKLHQTLDRTLFWKDLLRPSSTAKLNHGKYFVQPYYVSRGFNAFATVMQVFKRFTLLHLFLYWAVPFANLRALPAIETAVADGVLRAIDRRRKTDHLDPSNTYCLPPVPFFRTSER